MDQKNTGNGSGDALSHLFRMISNIRFPEWLERTDKSVGKFYRAMKVWELVCPDPDMKKLTTEQVEALPFFKDHASSLISVTEHCERQPELNRMLKMALVGLTLNCFEERKADVHMTRYAFAFDTVANLMTLPSSPKCHHPKYFHDGSLVEKALSESVKAVSMMIFEQMREDGLGDHVDYLIDTCVHYGMPDCRYARATKSAMRGAFSNAYATMSAADKAHIKFTNYYCNNITARKYIDELISEAVSNVAPSITHHKRKSASPDAPVVFNAAPQGSQP